MTPNQVRLSTASEPATFVITLMGLIATFALSHSATLGVILSLLTGTILASPWIGPLRRRANARQRRARDQRRRQEQRQREQKILQSLPLGHQNRFWIIRNRVWSVSQSLDHRPQDPTWQQVQEQLARLPETALRLLRDLHNVERLLDQADELHLYRQIDDLAREVERASPRLGAIKASRQAVLRRRQEQLQHAHEEREVIFTQLSMIEDIIDLLRESSLLTDDTREVSCQLEDLMLTLDVTEEAAREATAIATADEVAELAVFEERIAV
ncbi:MAG: hypothetical protein CMH57_03830 [Myxococcales bacterium]|nr:hypothetical protein [Myxococcales bacterium]